MSEITNELRLKILQTARRKIEAGYVLGDCYADEDPGAANPMKGYCLRGALKDAIKEHKADMHPEGFGIAVGDSATLCAFSDTVGKDGCLKAIDKAIAKLAA